VAAVATAARAAVQRHRARRGRRAVQRQQGVERGVADRRHRHPHEEAVEEGLQRLVGRQLVAGRHHADERRALAAAAVVELALVQQRQQRVEDRRVGLEHLVEEGDAGGRQEAFGQAFVAVGFQRLQRQGAEQFLGRGETRQQALEVRRAVEGPVQPARQFALRGAGRADQQHVLAGQRGQQRQPHRGLAFEQAAFELRDPRAQVVWGGQRHRRNLVRCTVAREACVIMSA
jgi:hypothetical protein